MARDSFRLRTAAGWLTGIALLRDMFTSINNRSGGYEHVLARRHGKEVRINSTAFEKRNSAQERARRLKQFNRRERVPVVYVGPATSLKGATALARNFDGKRVSIQMDKFAHEHAHGWHPYNAAYWAVR